MAAPIGAPRIRVPTGSGEVQSMAKASGTKKKPKRARASAGDAKAFWAETLRTVYTIRHFETQGVQLYRQGLIRGYFHPYWGEEAIAVGICAALDKSRDYISSSHRGHGHCIAWGADLKKMVAELLGREDGYCRGRGGSMHIADVRDHNLGANGIVAAGMPIGVGAALGIKIRGEDGVAVTFSSDGGANNGAFAEALNLAGAWKLPFVGVIENNQYAVSTRIEEATAETELYKRGIGIGIESHRVDGQDVKLVHELASDAVAKCRRGEGPVLIEAVTFRKSGHHVNDPGKYMPEDRLAYYEERDAVKIAGGHFLDAGGGDDEIAAIMEEVEREYDEAVEFAKASPQPSVEGFLAELATH